MAEDNRPKDTRKFVREILEQVDGPNPEEVESELLKNPPITAVCEHCQEPMDKPPGSVEQPKLLNISEPKKSE